MKKTFREKFLFSFLFLVFIASEVVIQKVYAAPSSHLNSPVLAHDYCAFLNDPAVTNAQEFYHEKMGSDEAAASIIEKSGPHFFVIAGREDFPIHYLNEAARQAYLAWLGQREKVGSRTFQGIEDAKVDSSFATSEDDFLITIVSNKLSLIGASEKNSSWLSEGGKDLLIAAGAIAFFEGSRRGFNYCYSGQNIEGEEAENNPQLAREASAQRKKAETLNKESLALIQKAQEDASLTQEQVEHLEDLSAVKSGDALQAEAARKRLLRKAEETEEQARARKGEGRNQRLQNFDDSRKAMDALGKIYDEASKLETSAEESMIENSRKLLLLEKYVAEETILHRADTNNSDDGETDHEGSLQSDLKKAKRFIEKTKQTLETLRKLKRNTFAARQVPGSHFLADRDRIGAETKFANVLKTLQNSFDSGSINWNDVLAKADQAIEADRQQRESDLAEAKKVEAKEKKDVVKAEAQAKKSFLNAFFAKDKIEKEKKEASEAKAKAIQAEYDLKAVDQVKVAPTKKYEKVSKAFDLAAQELRDAWEVLHLTERQFIRADMLRDFIEAYTGKKSLHAEQGIARLGLLLNQIRKEVVTAEGDFEKIMNAIQASFNAVGDKANENVNRLLYQLASQIKSDGAHVNTDEYRAKTVEEILNDAQESLDILNTTESLSDEERHAHKDKLQDAMAGLDSALENIEDIIRYQK